LKSLSLKILDWIGSSKKDLLSLPEEVRRYEVSSGNVFADLGLPDADELLMKAGIVSQINDLINQKKLSQKAASKFLTIDPVKMLALNSGKLSKFSMEELFRYLNILGQEVIIKIKPKNKSKKKEDVSIALPVRNKKPIITPRNTSSNARSIQVKKKVHTTH